MSVQIIRGNAGRLEAAAARLDVRAGRRYDSALQREAAEDRAMAALLREIAVQIGPAVHHGRPPVTEFERLALSLAAAVLDGAS